MLNFRTLMVTDANAASTDAEHTVALIALYLTFGNIMDTEMLVGCRNTTAAPAVPSTSAMLPCHRRPAPARGGRGVPAAAYAAG